MAGRIFISYRREDTPGMAGRIYDRLAQNFSPSDIFMDVDSMVPGVDFVKQLEEQVGACDVLLAIIGVGWFEAKDAKTGGRRLDNVRDFVRIEIAAALKRDIRVIPVLLQGVEMPQADSLPEDIKLLSQRHAVSVRHDRFGDDVRKLIEACKCSLRIVPESPAAEFDEEFPEEGFEGDDSTVPQKGGHWKMFAALVLSAAAVVVGGGYGYEALVGGKNQKIAPIVQAERRPAWEVPAIPGDKAIYEGLRSNGRVQEVSPVVVPSAPAPDQPSLEDRIDEALRRAGALNAGGFYVSLKSAPDEKAVQRDLPTLTEKYKSVLGDVQLTVKIFDLGTRGITYRAVAGPLATKQEAMELCEKIKGVGGDKACFVAN
jgi:hypothetical protein